MKKLMIFALTLSFTLFLCENKGAAASTNGAGKEVAAYQEAKTPIYVVNEADWVATDLSGTSSLTPIIVKLPKNAVLEKNGGTDIKISDNYIISVRAQAVSSMKELIKINKELTVGRTARFVDIKILKDEPTGFVYTYTMKPEANGTTYNPETHFFYALQTKDGAFYSLSDNRSMTMNEERVYTKEAALKVYGIIKNSAKIKK
jgi:hypothetical protein